jgi:hypothetical protein
MVLALLGDNPMQSEFACHIGLKGKFFCRACWVKGTDAQAEAAPQRSDSPQTSSHGSEAEINSQTGSVEGSEASERGGDDATSTMSDTVIKGRRKRILESMSNMVDRVRAFVKVMKLEHLN